MEMMEESKDLIGETCRLLKGTLSCYDKATVDSSADGLDRLSSLPAFPLSLLAIAQDGDTLGLRIASATYLKNLIRRYIDRELFSPDTHKEFRNQLAVALLKADQAVLKVLIEAFRLVITKDFVRENSWPELVPQLKAVIENSNLISGAGYSQWNTLNALTVLQAVTRPFQYFLNPKLPKEPVPEQLEQVASEILAPLQATFHHFVDKVLSVNDGTQGEYEQALLILCKSLYFSVRSYMPSGLTQVIPSICHDVLRILDALRLDSTLSDKYQLRLKIAKRGLIIFCTLICRHRKHTDKLLRSILNSAINIARQSIHIGVLDSLSDRIISLSFDVISHVLETGPGWRLVSSHFSTLLDSAIFPALSLNQKDMAEWDEDTEEYIRKNLPCELDEATGWAAEDLFTARKSAINLLGVIAISKGPPTVPAASKRKKGDTNKKKQQNSSMGELLVIPFLSKFPIPSDGEETLSKTVQDYYGVLMAYGGVQDFLKDKASDYAATLIRNRVLPLYFLHKCTPYLVATSNWLLGELAPCLPQTMSGEIYNALTKALVTPDTDGINCYPVRASAVGALASLLDNEHFPSDWSSFLQTVVGRVGTGDENESSILFQLITSIVESGQQNIAMHVPGIVSAIASALSYLIPPIPEPWPQVVEKGIACLAVLVQTWVAVMPDDSKQQMTDIASVLSNLLQKAWLMPVELMGEEAVIPPPSSINDASMLLSLIIQFTDSPGEARKFKVKELLAVFADIIADYHAWEEMEDQGIFNTIKEAIYLFNKFDLNSNTIITSSFIEGVSSFVSEGINAYTSATLRACTCVHLLLHGPEIVVENEPLRRTIAVQFASAAFLRLKQLSDKKAEVARALILAISSCYLLYPECIERILEQRESGGSFYWASKLAFISRSGISTETEAKLAVLTLAKVVDRLLMLSATDSDLLLDCFVALMEVSLRLNDLQEDSADDDDAHETDDDDDDDSEDEDDDDEDTEDEVLEETQDEFLSKCAAAAQNLTNFVDEEDVDDDDYIIDLGILDDIDALSVVRSLVKQHQVLAQGKMLSQDLIDRINETFPEYQLILGASTES